jgi:hypothetical protein
LECDIGYDIIDLWYQKLLISTMISSSWRSHLEHGSRCDRHGDRDSDRILRVRLGPCGQWWSRAADRLGRSWHGTRPLPIPGRLRVKFISHSNWPSESGFRANFKPRPASRRPSHRPVPAWVGPGPGHGPSGLPSQVRLSGVQVKSVMIIHRRVCSTARPGAGRLGILQPWHQQTGVPWPEYFYITSSWLFYYPILHALWHYYFSLWRYYITFVFANVQTIIFIISLTPKGLLFHSGLWHLYHFTYSYPHRLLLLLPLSHYYLHYLYLKDLNYYYYLSFSKTIDSELWYHSSKSMIWYMI